MICFHHVEIDNFSSVAKGQRLRLDDRGLISIRGENDDTTGANNNGAGKTSIFKAITWVLYGRCVDGDKTDEVINTRAGDRAKAFVGLEISDIDWYWRIERTCTRSGRKLHLGRRPVDDMKAEFESQDGATMSDTQLSIERLLGMDFDAWRNTVLFGQGDVKRFGDKDTTDAERKTVLKRILDLSVFDKAAEIVLQKRRTLSAQVDSLTSAAESSQESVDDLKRRVDELRDSESQYESKRESTIDDMSESAIELEDEAKEFEASAGKIVEVDGIIEQCKSDLKAVRESQSEGNKLAGEYEFMRKRHDGFNESVSEKRIEAAEFQSKIENMRSNAGEILDRIDGINELGTCPTCGNPADTEHTRVLVKSLETQATGLIDQIDKELLPKFQAAMDSIESDLEAKSAVSADMEKTQRLIDEIKSSADDDARVAMDNLNDAKASKTRLMADKAHAVDKRAELKRVMDRITATKAETNPYGKMLSHEVEQLKKIAKILKTIQVDLDKTRADQALNEFWRRGFGNAGLPSMIMDTMMPVLTERANHYLRTLSDGDITIKFDTESETKGGDTRDRIAIVANIEGSGDVTPSGGQHKRIAIAVDLALMDVIAEREGNPIDILFLDEVLDGLDPAGRANVMKVLIELRAKRSSVFVITQDDDLSSWFEHVITVRKSDGLTTIQDAAA